MQHGTGLGARRFPGFSDLSLDLRLTENHRVQPGGNAVEMRSPVVHADDLDAPAPGHVRLTRHRNRSAPGCVSLRATYTNSTAPKPAMLARAARRPAQWRTTRTQTAHPSTTHVKMPHTT